LAQILVTSMEMNVMDGFSFYVCINIVLFP